MLKRVSLIGPLPKEEASGVGLGFESLVDGFQATSCDVIVVDSAGARPVKKSGAFAVGRALDSIIIVFKAWTVIPGRQVLYMTVASSRLGFVRDMFIIWWARLFKKRIVLHLKGGGYRDFHAAQPVWLRRLIAGTFGQSTHIIVLGELLRDQFEFVEDLDRKLKVVPNGLTKNLTVAKSGAKRLPEPGKPLRLLYLSNLIPSKGYLTLLGACICLAREHAVDLVCSYCGAFTQTIVDAHSVSAEEQKKEFLVRIAASGMEDRIFYRGTVCGEMKEQLLAQAHLFVLPTRYPWEGQPISIIEALAFATPVISTPHKGIPEQVRDGYNGFLVPPDDPDALAGAILKAVATPEHYRALSLGAQEHYQRNFTREVHLERLIAVICNDQQAEQQQASASCISFGSRYVDEP